MKFSSGVLVLVLAVSWCSAAPSEQHNSIESNEVEPSTSWERMAKMMSSCVGGEEDVLSCVAIKGVTAINRAARMQDFDLFQGVHFERDSSVSVRDGKSLETESEISRNLPAEPLQRSARLLSMLMDATTNFLQSHKLQVKLDPEEIATASRTFNEARGKIKKMLGPILLGIGVKILAVVAIVGGGLVLLVTKALIVAKLAFLFASILGLQKLFLGSSILGSKVSGVQPLISSPALANPGWSSGVANGGAWNQNAGNVASYPYARSYENEAQDLAYGAQKQAN